MDENGIKFITPESQQQRGKRCLTSLLNIHSGFDVKERERVSEQHPRPEIVGAPSAEEVKHTVVKFWNRKAKSESGIHPEIVKAACSVLELPAGQANGTCT